MKMFENALSSGKSYQAFAAPEDILADPNLRGSERRRLLDDWKLELELLTTATAENMPDQQARTGNGAPEELLRRVNACRRLLSEEEEQ